MARNLVAVALIAAALLALWIFPAVIFAHPGTNDALWLADVQFLLILVGWAGIIVAVVSAGQHRASVCVTLGTYVIGAAAGLILGLVVFGNMTNDRFLPLLFLPPLIAAPGLFLMFVGVLVSTNRRELLRPALYGAAGAVFVGAWILIRGSLDWLLAPYGFDELVVMIVVGVALVNLRPLLRG